MNLEQNWPYPRETDHTERYSADVIVLGGGIAGCMAAIAAARGGAKVILVDKGGVRRSGAGGSGCDHWESAATNPASSVTPEELTQAMLDDNDGFNNPISHYIECREGYDRLLDIERMGGKVRDAEGEFKGAAFRDENTGLLYAYDYKNRFTLRIWGTTFKPAMANELKRLGVTVIERTMITALLTEKGESGARCTGAMGFDTRTGAVRVFSGKACVMAMSRPARVWLFSAAYPGLCEFRPLSCIGDGHAMGWRIGAEFNMMEKSVRAEFSSAGRSYPPYSAGNNHNTWYPASLVDADGREIPYADRDGNILADVMQRFYPAQGQKYFMKGGSIDNPVYQIEGPETLPYDKLRELGYRLPFYADLSNLPELERKAIWGLMIGQEGKTNVPVLRNYTEAGFDPTRHVLQCYGVGWTSAEFLPQERQLFGLPGGFMNDWELMTNIPGLFVCGDALFASNCYGHAAATGGYAGRHAAKYIRDKELLPPDEPQIERERARIFAPLDNAAPDAVHWKELNEAISKTMQNYCAEQKRDELLSSGLDQLEYYEREILPHTAAANPHELTRLLEVHDILTVAQMILHACLARKQSCNKLEFYRTDDDGQPAHPFIVMRKSGEGVLTRDVPMDFAGDLIEGYLAHNPDYVPAPDSANIAMGRCAQ